MVKTRSMEKKGAIHLITILLALLVSGTAVYGQDGTEKQNDKPCRVTRYSSRFEGRKTASGDTFSQRGFTGASRRYPMGTLIRITNPKNGKNVIVKINDRCRRRDLIDISLAAFRAIEATSNMMIETEVLPTDSIALWEKQESDLTEEEIATTAKIDKKTHKHTKKHKHRRKTKSRKKK